MISLIEALNYRCLRYVRQPLGPFHVMVGPNASGKTSFLDVPAFLRDLVTRGLLDAVFSRTRNFSDLVWQGEDAGFELAIEVGIPDRIVKSLGDARGYDTVRYELAVRLDSDSKAIAIVGEQGILETRRPEPPPERPLFPELRDRPATLLTTRSARGTRTLFRKTPGGNDNYYAEARPKEGRWRPSFKLKSTLQRWSRPIDRSAASSPARWWLAIQGLQTPR